MPGDAGRNVQMPKKELISLYRETFAIETDGLPGGWYVEQNTDMPQVPAIQCGDHCVELLSAGNKFLPVIPDTADCRVRFSAKINYAAAEQFGIIVCFGYDSFSGRGQYVRFLNPPRTDEVQVEYGTTALNIFTPQEIRKIQVDREIFDQTLDFELTVKGVWLEIRMFNQYEIRFSIRRGTGKIAFAREHFWDVLKITRLEIEGTLPEKIPVPVSFTVPMPDAPTWYPIFCDVTLTDYGNCFDADLSFHGGVAETEAGEGNYHGLRADLLTRPYLKVLTADRTEKHVVYNRTLVLVPPGIAPKYLYMIIYEKPDWPFRRKIRFMKPAGQFDLAVGFENYHHNTLPDLEMNNAETMFTPRGKILYTGASVEEKSARLICFHSQPEKEIIGKLPKSDPRYAQAVKFAQVNHYFFEREAAQFKITLAVPDELPVRYEVILEDAFLRKIRELDFTSKKRKFRLGVRTLKQIELDVEPLTNLTGGVYHLRVRSNDPSVNPLEDYCPFEVMSRKAGAPPPPLLSGLPFLYDSRTETRGLMTDAFDPWKNAQMNNGHYISCANFLPPAARKYKVYSTIKAYGRKNYAWIGSRCLDDASIEGNLDIIKKADYVNINEHLSCANLTWGSSYQGKRLEMLIDFLSELKDAEFDLRAMRKMLRANRILPAETTRKVFEKYWEEWLDYVNEKSGKKAHDLLKKLRKDNPDLKMSLYGPFSIYAGALKGPEALRITCRERFTPDLIAFWQYEDYPVSCGYGLERGLYQLTASLMALPGSRIYPEIYTGGKLKQGCPDGAVFYASPPFGISWKDRSEKTLTRQIANFAFASGHLMSDGFHFWDKRGFQACRFTRRWFEAILRIWPYVLEHPADCPLRSAAYISSEASRRACGKVLTEITLDWFIDTRKTATEDVPYIYECAAKAGVCAGFQVSDENLGKLTPDQADTLVLPPLRGMSDRTLKRIRALHDAGVNLIGHENVDGLEDLFGVRDTGVMKRVTEVVPTGKFCAGMNEYCDDPRCAGSYAADGAEILLNAEIPVLTLQRNAKASAAFFNVPPHLVREDRLRQKVCSGRNGISRLMETAAGGLMKSFSQTGISISSGRLIACHTKDGATLVIVANPDDEHALETRIAIRNSAGLNGNLKTNHEIVLTEENRAERVYRVLLPKGDLLLMLFLPQSERFSAEGQQESNIVCEIKK